MDYQEIKDRLVDWVREWFEKNGKTAVAVLGMSGGKDSTVAAAVCAEALGKDRVVGVAMPAEGQSINEADEICKYLGIKYICVPIGDMIKGFGQVATALENGLSKQAEQNIPPRVRMAVVYAVSQSLGGRVVNTCNLSEDWVGYSTRWGDGVGDFSPFANLTVRDVRAIGHLLGVPAKWVDKIPDDGLPHSCSDEEKFGFSYDTLDTYIRTSVCDDPAIKEKIDRMHAANLFKMSMPDSFKL